MNDLPPEIIQMILEYLNFADVLYIRNVSKKLQKTIQITSIWREIICVIQSNGFTKSTRSVINITDKSCFYYQSCLVGIRHIKSSHYNDLSYHTINPLFHYLPNLKTIDFSNNFDIDDICIDLISKSCIDLESLKLSKCYKITEQSLLYIVKRLRKLKVLDVTSTRCITNRAWLILCSMTDTLCELSMGNNSDVDWDLLINIYPPNLLYWNLTNSYNLTADYLIRLAKYRKKIKPVGLLSINVHDCEQLTGDEIEYIHGIQDAKLHLIANPKLKNHSADGVLDYLKYILQS
ncbi:hypothetical protein BC833DRAFT_629825 [Globomyces pollinis-pini]|nr:hypothetical protein BC833DRAFT_629825 [Globomyces pollinis-pini]